MSKPDLVGAISLEKENLQLVLADIARARTELDAPDPSPTIISGAASYIAQCYGGIESILKRVVKYENLILPSTGEWHIELLKSFRKKPGNILGMFDEELFSRLSLMRKFRHVVIHGYGFKFDRTMVSAALEDVPAVVAGFLSVIDRYLEQ